MPVAREADSIEESVPNTIVSGSATVIIGDGSTPTRPQWEASLYDRLASAIDFYNATIDPNTGVVADLMVNRAVNFVVQATVRFSLRVTDSRRIETFEFGPRKDAT